MVKARLLGYKKEYFDFFQMQTSNLASGLC